MGMLPPCPSEKQVSLHFTLQETPIYTGSAWRESKIFLTGVAKSKQKIYKVGLAIYIITTARCEIPSFMKLYSHDLRDGEQICSALFATHFR